MKKRRRPPSLFQNKKKKASPPRLPIELVVEVLLFLQTAESFNSFRSVSTHHFEELSNHEYLLKHLTFHLRGAVRSNVPEIGHVRNLDCSGFIEVEDATLLKFRGLKSLDISYCRKLTDAAFRYLGGVHSLVMNDCNQRTITDAAFSYLEGIDTLDISFCHQDTITDRAFSHLKGIKRLSMILCDQGTITDSAFSHLGGIEALDMRGCNQRTITDSAFQHLRGIFRLYMAWCDQATVTDAALRHVRGLRILDISYCKQFTKNAISHLRGIDKLNASHTNLTTYHPYA